MAAARHLGRRPRRDRRHARPRATSIAGFEVVHLPGHAPGLIGLFRESDRLALVSDRIYTLDPQSGRKEPAHVPHPAFNQDTEQARASIRKLAALDPPTVWAGHADPVTGDVTLRSSSAPRPPRPDHARHVAKQRKQKREKLAAPTSSTATPRATCSRCAAR